MRDDLVLDIKEKDPNFSQSNTIPSETLDACISLVEIMYKMLRTAQIKLTVYFSFIFAFHAFQCCSHIASTDNTAPGSAETKREHK